MLPVKNMTSTSESTKLDMLQQVDSHYTYRCVTLRSLNKPILTSNLIHLMVSAILNYRDVVVWHDTLIQFIDKYWLTNTALGPKSYSKKLECVQLLYRFCKLQETGVNILKIWTMACVNRPQEFKDLCHRLLALNFPQEIIGSYHFGLATQQL